MDLLLAKKVKVKKENPLKMMKQSREEARKTILLLLLNPNY